MFSKEKKKNYKALKINKVYSEKSKDKYVFKNADFCEFNNNKSRCSSKCKDNNLNTNNLNIKNSKRYNNCKKIKHTRKYNNYDISSVSMINCDNVRIKKTAEMTLTSPLLYQSTDKIKKNCYIRKETNTQNLLGNLKKKSLSNKDINAANMLDYSKYDIQNKARKFNLDFSNNCIYSDNINTQNICDSIIINQFNSDNLKNCKNINLSNYCSPNIILNKEINTNNLREDKLNINNNNANSNKNLIIKNNLLKIKKSDKKVCFKLNKNIISEDESFYSKISKSKLSKLASSSSLLLLKNRSCSCKSINNYNKYLMSDLLINININKHSISKSLCFKKKDIELNNKLNSCFLFKKINNKDFSLKKNLNDNENIYNTYILRTTNNLSNNSGFYKTNCIDKNSIKQDNLVCNKCFSSNKDESSKDNLEFRIRSNLNNILGENLFDFSDNEYENIFLFDDDKLNKFSNSNKNINLNTKEKTVVDSISLSKYYDCRNINNNNNNTAKYFRNLICPMNSGMDIFINNNNSNYIRDNCKEYINNNENNNNNNNCEDYYNLKELVKNIYYTPKNITDNNYKHKLSKYSISKNILKKSKVSETKSITSKDLYKDNIIKYLNLSENNNNNLSNDINKIENNKYNCINKKDYKYNNIYSLFNNISKEHLISICKDSSKIKKFLDDIYQLDYENIINIVDAVAASFTELINNLKGKSLIKEFYYLLVIKKASFNFINKINFVNISLTENYYYLLDIFDYILNVNKSDLDIIYSQFNKIEFWAESIKHKYSKCVVEYFIINLFKNDENLLNTNNNNNKLIYNSEMNKLGEDSNYNKKHSILFNYLKENLLDLSKRNYSTFVCQVFIENTKLKSVLDIILNNFIYMISCRNCVFVLQVAVFTYKDLKLFDKIIEHSELISKSMFASTLMENILINFKEETNNRFIEKNIKSMSSKNIKSN